MAAALVARVALAQAPVLEPAPADADAGEISRRAAAAIVGERTFYEAALLVRKHGEATQDEVVFRAWYERRSARSFVRVLAPHGQAGTGVPEAAAGRVALCAARRQHREPDAARRCASPGSAAASGSSTCSIRWRVWGQAPARLLGVDATAAAQGGERAYVLELRPDGDAKGGRVIAWVGAERATPQRLDWRDAKDALVATLRFDDVREVGGRAVPHRWTLTRPAAPKRESRIELREIRFDPVFDDAIFTTRQLLQRGAAAAAGAAQGARLPAPGGSPP